MTDSGTLATGYPSLAMTPVTPLVVSFPTAMTHVTSAFPSPHTSGTVFHYLLGQHLSLPVPPIGDRPRIVYPQVTALCKQIVKDMKIWSMLKKRLGTSTAEETSSQRWRKTKGTAIIFMGTMFRILEAEYSYDTTIGTKFLHLEAVVEFCILSLEGF